MGLQAALIKRVHYHCTVCAFKDFDGPAVLGDFINQLNGMFAKVA